MRVGGELVGRWGLAVLAVAGVAGLVLAIHGWSGGGASAAPPLAGGPLGAASAAPSRDGSLFCRRLLPGHLGCGCTGAVGRPFAGRSGFVVTCARAVAEFGAIRQRCLPG